MALPYYSFISWKLGPLTIYSYGLFVAIAFLAGIFLAVKGAKKRNISTEQIYDLIFYIIIASISGARIAYVIEYWHNFDSFIDIFKIWEGGLSFIGGLIGALIAVFAYVKLKKLNFWKTADIFAPALALGHAIGRIGCYLTGLHIGKLTTVPWAVMVNNELRHQTALYDIIAESANFLILWKLRTKKAFDGFLFLLYLMMYSTERFVIDFFRADPLYYGLTATQWSLIFVFLIAGFLFIRYKKTEAGHERST